MGFQREPLVKRESATPMNCSEFLAGFSEYYDGRLEDREAGRYRTHARDCDSCGRYERVVRKAGGVLRKMEPLDVPEDFHPRLQHRIYHVDDGDVLSNDGPGGSGVSGATAIGMALLLSMVAWSPTLRAPEPEFQLSPLVAERPVERSAVALIPTGRFLPTLPLYESPTPFPTKRPRGDVLGRPPHTFLFEYSRLNAGSRGGSALRQVGLDR